MTTIVIASDNGENSIVIGITIAIIDFYSDIMVKTIEYSDNY